MKRFHVHAHVDDLNASVAFYSKLFAAEPTRLETDYAKWMLEDPRINFAISQRGAKPGVDHIGFQVDTEEELAALRDQVGKAEIAALDQPETTCCYARSSKYWITDPQGVAWETYRTMGEAEIYGSSRKEAVDACCAPESSIVAMPQSAQKCC